jgi:iron complex transport system substrate-binding protein
MISRRSLLFVTLLLASCRLTNALERHSMPYIDVAGSPEANLSSECVRNYRPDIDYFPNKATVRQARTFRVEYHNNYKLLEFQSNVSTRESYQYLLVQCGTPVPSGFPKAVVVEVPVMRFNLNQSPTSMALVVDELQLTDRLAGVNSYRDVTVPSIRKRIDNHEIAETGSGTHSAIESTLATNPDLIFTFYSAFANANTHPKLIEVGIKAVPLAEHFEPTPLGRSEWMKFLAVFFNREKEAETLFDSAEQRYLELRKLTDNVQSRPGVLLGFASGRGVWALNGGRNFVARYVEDAGGEYVWKSDTAMTLELGDFERVFDVSAQAGVWLGNAVAAKSRAALVHSDFRLQYFRPIRDDASFSNDRGRTAWGAIPFANESVARPDAALADLIRIIHPELQPDHTLIYYRRIE